MTLQRTYVYKEKASFQSTLYQMEDFFSFCKNLMKNPLKYNKLHVDCDTTPLIDPFWQRKIFAFKQV